MSSKEEKGCLGRFLKIIFIGLLACVGLGLLMAKLFGGFDESTAPKASATSSITAQPTAATTATIMATAEPLDMPGIDGSNAYDITVSLKEMGIEVGERQSVDGGYQWLISFNYGENVGNIEINANKAYEVCLIQASASGSDRSLLTWLATMPHLQANQERTLTWLKGVMETGESSSITVGDVVWEYTGKMLTVKDVEADAYFDALVDRALGL